MLATLKMFTGIVAHLGEVIGLDAGTLTLSLPEAVAVPVGGSLAVNGVCLTATRVDGIQMTTDLSPETLKKTALGVLTPGQAVNLERPCRVGDTLDGHFVQGHVDTVGRVIGIQPEGNSYRFSFEVDAQWDRYLVEKGSVAVDGISLTVYDIKRGRFEVAIIPHTYAHTNLHQRRAGDPVNVEFDVLGKYTEKLLQTAGRTEA